MTTEHHLGPPYSRPPSNEADPVHDYLTAHPWLDLLVAEARQEIARLFGADVRIRLEVVSDEAGDEGLFAIVTTALPAEVAYATLARLDEEWLFDAPTRGQFNVDIEVGRDAV